MSSQTMAWTFIKKMLLHIILGTGGLEFLTPKKGNQCFYKLSTQRNYKNLNPRLISIKESKFLPTRQVVIWWLRTLRNGH